MTEEEWMKQLSERLGRSKFRSRFHLSDKDKDYIVNEIVSSCSNINASVEVSDDQKVQLFELLEDALSTEVDDLGINLDDSGITIDITMDDDYKCWYFKYTELGLDKGLESAVAYIENTIFSYFDNLEIEEGY